MTVALSGEEIATKLEEQFPAGIIESNKNSLSVKSEVLFKIVSFLKTAKDYSFDYLNSITATDYFDYYEVVYHLTSIEYNHILTLKTRCYDRETPAVPSIVSLYKGADFQEREVYDLMGIKFEGHPNLKRIMLYDGFQGHPLRKDFL
ncbi:NADH-quinone oxidoreductase subunit C [Chloroflexota bacterium]